MPRWGHTTSSFEEGPPLGEVLLWERSLESPGTFPVGWSFSESLWMLLEYSELGNSLKLHNYPL
jgi:hypothetical protein